MYIFYDYQAAGRLESMFSQNMANDFEELMNKGQRETSSERDEKLVGLENVLEEAQQIAESVCLEGSTEECSAAWDIYDEILNESTKQKNLRDSGRK